MMPDALMVPFSGAVSNQRSRKSAALMVISCTKVSCCFRGRAEKSLTRDPSPAASRGSGRRGSVGVIDRMGLMKRAICAISWPYSS